MQLEEYLIKENLSQSAFANKIKVVRSLVNDWIHRRKFPSAENMAAIHLITHGQVTANDFFHPQLKPKTQLTGKAKIAGVMGWPVSHSLSPRLHGYWLEKHGIDGTYIPLSVTPEDVPEVLRALPKMGFRGCNLTVPHKEIAVKLVDRMDSFAASIGAVNTVVVEEDGTLTGSNTDAYGFIQNLKDGAGELQSYLPKILILGAGGAARGVIASMLAEGAEQIVLTNRSQDKAKKLAEDFASPAISVIGWEERHRALEGTTLLVNTTSLGMKGQPELEIILDALPVTALVTDIVYNPLLTGLLLQAKARGNPIVDGIGMLLHQAVPGFAAWFRITPKVDKGLRDHVLRGLA